MRFTPAVVFQAFVRYGENREACLVRHTCGHPIYKPSWALLEHRQHYTRTPAGRVNRAVLVYSNLDYNYGYGDREKREEKQCLFDRVLDESILVSEYL